MCPKVITNSFLGTAEKKIQVLELKLARKDAGFKYKEYQLTKEKEKTLRLEKKLARLEKELEKNREDILKYRPEKVNLTEEEQDMRSHAEAREAMLKYENREQKDIIS